MSEERCEMAACSVLRAAPFDLIGHGAPRDPEPIRAAYELWGNPKLLFSEQPRYLLLRVIWFDKLP